MYDREHKEVKMEIIITPYKLLHPGHPFARLKSIEEYDAAYIAFQSIVEEISEDTGLTLLNEFKIHRVDLTHDVRIPSQDYARDIISVCKATELPKGYKFWNPSDEQLEQNGWDPVNACLYKNQNRGIMGKIYDKTRNLSDFGYLQEDAPDGYYVRFELTLKRKYLKKEGLLVQEDISETIRRIMVHNDYIFFRCFTDIFEQGSMFSKDVLSKYIMTKCGRKKKKIEKMKEAYQYEDNCRKNGTEFDKNEYPSGKNTLKVVKKHYSCLGISMIPLSKECPFIPSFNDMMNNTYNRPMLYFARSMTRKKVYWDE